MSETSKEVEKIVKDWVASKKPSPPPADGPKINPVFAHASYSPVKISGKLSLHGIEAHKDDRFNFLSSLFKKGERYYAEIKTYSLDSSDREYPVFFDSKDFNENEKNKIAEYVSMPSRVFALGKHLKAAVFKDSLMTEEEFEDILELWRQKPPQQKT